MATRRSRSPGLCALALVAALLAPDSAAARLDAKAWKAAKAEFDQLFAQKGRPKEKAAVVKTIAGDGSARAWKLLAQAFTLEVQRVAEIQSAYAEAAGVHGDILLTSIAGYSVDAENRAKALQAQLATLEAEDRDEREALAAVIGTAVGAPPAARKNILKLVKSKTPWPVRAAVARVAGGSTGDRASLSYLKKALASETDRRVRGAALEGMAGAKALHEKAHDLVIARLTDADVGVVLRAAEVVRKHPFAESGVPLQTAWKDASPRVRVGLGAAIEAVLADASLGPASAELKAWWDKQAKAAPEARAATIPLVSDGLLFVFDISGAMKAELKDGPWLPVPEGSKGDDAGLSGPRVELAKFELKRTMRRLPESTKFNILAFNHGATVWKRSMQAATEKNKELAYRWMGGLKASGSAYVAGALRLAFRTAGFFAIEEDAEVPEVDTVVLLSFGKPTDNSFPTHKFMQPEDVLSRVALWNASPRLTIHAVCFGKSEFMRELAARNNGGYVHR